MAVIRNIALLGMMGCVLLAGQQTMGQGVQRASYEQPVAQTSTPALRYFGRGTRTPVAQPRSRRQAVTAQPYQLAGGKPFQDVNNRSTISPWLSLDTVETSVGLPNYYARVLPKMQQEEANQAQAAELRRLKQQLRLANAPGKISNNRNGGVPTTGRSSQFMNVGGYFPPMRR